jgi:outer membrane receptor protein involved in Fe transport
MVNPWNAARRAGRILAFACLALLALAAAAPAQVNTATIEVVVNDNTNLPLPGVSVHIVGPATGYDQTVVTGATGQARLAAIPPGSYDVSFELSGFASLVQKSVVLRVGQTQVLNAIMQAKISETVTVTGAAPIVDIHKTDTSTNIVPEQIETLPVADRDFQKLSFIAPTVQRERGEFRFVTGGPVIGAGGNASQSTILVDGVDFTDPALGLATTRFSQDSIREFRVIANRFDSEIGGSAGGALSIVTKSGTNLLSGKAFSFFRDKGLRSQGALESTKADFSRQQFGGAVGGPLKKDKTYLFGSLEQINENNVTLYKPLGAYALASGTANVKLPFRQTLSFLRLDQNISNSQRLAAKFVYERYRQDNFRVGGVSDAIQGLHLNRDNFNLNAEHTWTGGSNKLNQLFIQAARRKYVEPPMQANAGMGEWFSSGNTLRTGGSIYADLLGEGTYLELRDTFTLHKDTKSAGTHDFKFGGNWQVVKDRFLFDSYPSGLMIYVTDNRTVPLAYTYGVGSANSKITTNRLAGYLQDDWSVRPNLRLNLGLRYDVDTNGNNPGFSQPLAGIASPRKRDLNNIQPRGSFSWDVDGSGRNVVRGGGGIFTGRFLLVPTHTENQQNGVTGRQTYQRINGLLLGLPAAFWLNAASPTTTGVLSKLNIALLEQDYVAPQATQANIGLTSRLGRTGLFFDTEFVYVKGTNEVALHDANWSGNATHLRPNANYNQMNVYTNAGHSEYKAWIASLNGTLKGGHVITLSYTLGSKRNISDDFSPEFPTGYPNDPANLEAEYGRSRSDERHHVVLTAVLRAPFGMSVAPVIEYGSGQPWTKRLGYDFNGDGVISDRPAEEPRFNQNGPKYKNVNLRLTKAVKLSGPYAFEVIFEVFNLFDTTNYNVTSVDGAMYLSGPTIASPAAAYKDNPNFGKYSATLPSREAQIGVRFSF